MPTAIPPRKASTLPCLLLSAWMLGPAHAQWNDLPLQVSGFATLGLAYHDNAEAGLVFSGAQKRPVFDGLSANLDTVAGIQLDYAPLSSTSFALQVVTRSGEDWEPKVRMALARQQLSDNLTLRLGRMRSPVFMDSDSIEIGYSNPMVRPPMPVYVALANAAPFQDGIDLQWRTMLGEASILASAFYGRGEHKFYHFDKTGPVGADIVVEGITGVSLSASIGATTLRLAHTTTKSFSSKSAEIPYLNQGIREVVYGLEATAIGFSNAGLDELAGDLSREAQAISAFYDPYKASPYYTSLGFTTEIDNWHIVGEWAKLVTNNKTGFVADRTGYELTVAYSLGRFTPYVAISQIQRDNKALDTSAFVPTGFDFMSPNIAQLDAGIARLKAGLDNASAMVVGGMDAVTVGVRFDLQEKMTLKLQYDVLRSPNAMDAGILVAPKLPYKNQVRLLSASLDIVF